MEEILQTINDGAEQLGFFEFLKNKIENGKCLVLGMLITYMYDNKLIFTWKFHVLAYIL